MSKRNFCAYCGGLAFWKPGTAHPKKVCNCNYRYMRMGASGFSIQNTSRETTVANMRAEVEKYLKDMKQDVPCAFIFSVTRLDEKKIAKADAKRRWRDEEVSQ